MDNIMPESLNINLIGSAYDGDEIETKLFLDQGACVNYFDPKGYSAVHWSAFRGAVGNQLEVMKLLIRFGANLNSLTQNDRPQSVLSFAIYSGNVELVRLLLENGADCNILSNEVTPLMHAAQVNSVEAVKILLSYGADTKVVSKGYTARDYAIYYDANEIVKLLQEEP